MRQLRKNIQFKVEHFLIGILFLMGACSSGSIKISSAGNKTKIMAIGKDSKIKDLGYAPLELKQDDIFENQQYVEIVAQNDYGHLQRILLTRPFMQTDIDLSFDFKNEGVDPELIKAREGLEKVSLQIANAYKLISQKKFFEAQKALQDLKNEFPGISVIYDFLGNIEYLKGNFNQALLHYEKAHSINPNNIERELLIRRLRGSKVGI